MGKTLHERIAEYLKWSSAYAPEAEHLLREAAEALRNGAAELNAARNAALKEALSANHDPQAGTEYAEIMVTLTRGVKHGNGNT